MPPGPGAGHAEVRQVGARARKESRHDDLRHEDPCQPTHGRKSGETWTELEDGGAARALGRSAGTIRSTFPDAG
jgi:hypothetical protein